MTTEHTTNWPDLAIGLYEQLTGKNAVISDAASPPVTSDVGW